MANELLPCPFCGGEAETIRNGIGVFIGCFNENCPIGPATSTYVDGYATEAEAIVAWNTRADDYRQAAEYWQRMYEEAFAAMNKAAGNWAKADTELRKALDFMRIWISEDAHLGESAISYEFEKAEGLRKLDAIEDAITGKLNSRAERTCHIEGRYGNKYCTCCGEMVGTWDSTSELYVSGNMVELWNYCPNCGAKVVD